MWVVQEIYIEDSAGRERERHRVTMGTLLQPWIMESLFLSKWRSVEQEKSCGMGKSQTSVVARHDGLLRIINEKGAKVSTEQNDLDGKIIHRLDIATTNSSSLVAWRGLSRRSTIESNRLHCHGRYLCLPKNSYITVSTRKKSDV